MKSENKHIYEQIELYLDNRLTADEVDILWEQLIQDDDAMNYLETLSTLKQMAARDVFAEELSDNETEDANVTPLYTRVYRQSAVWLAAAAILIASIAGLAYFLQQQPGTTSSVGPVSMIEYDIYRSAENESNLPPSTQDIMATSAVGAHDEAIRMYDELVDETDEAPALDMRFLEASLYYNAGEYDMAVRLFETLAEDAFDENKHIYERSVWYSANGYLHLNKKQEAISLLNEIIALDKSYSRVAENLLRSLESK